MKKFILFGSLALSIFLGDNEVFATENINISNLYNEYINISNLYDEHISELRKSAGTTAWYSENGKLGNGTASAESIGVLGSLLSELGSAESKQSQNLLQKMKKGWNLENLSPANKNYILAAEVSAAILDNPDQLNTVQSLDSIITESSKAIEFGQWANKNDIIEDIKRYFSGLKIGEFLKNIIEIKNIIERVRTTGKNVKIIDDIFKTQEPSVDQSSVNMLRHMIREYKLIEADESVRVKNLNNDIQLATEIWSRMSIIIKARIDYTNEEDRKEFLSTNEGLNEPIQVEQTTSTAILANDDMTSLYTILSLKLTDLYEEYSNNTEKLAKDMLVLKNVLSETIAKQFIGDIFPDPKNTLLKEADEVKNERRAVTIFLVESWGEKTKNFEERFKKKKFTDITESDIEVLIFGINILSLFNNKDGWKKITPYIHGYSLGKYTLDDVKNWTLIQKIEEF